MPGIDDHVAWDHISGVNAGEVFGIGETHAAVRRFDGTNCSVPLSVLRPASYEDIEAFLETK